MSRKQTCAVIVTYQPRTASLLQALAALSGTVDGMVIVDNASANFEETPLHKAFPTVVIKKLETNKGIAAAQNEGIAVAKGAGYAYVLLLDQDSVPQDGMVRSLHDALERLEKQGHRVACVGPRTRFPGRTELSTFMPPGWLRLRRGIFDDATSTVQCEALIASGMLISMRVIDNVGGMEEGLFIDQVDTEWCLRARSNGSTGSTTGACSNRSARSRPSNSSKRTIEATSLTPWWRDSHTELSGESGAIQRLHFVI